MANSKIVIKNYNGTSYDELYPKTLAEQVVTTTTKGFVSDTEKATWNAKATTSVATTSTSGLMSNTDKTKLDGITAGAEVNVQADWAVSDTSSDTYIKNKPTLGSASLKNADNTANNIPLLNANGKLEDSVIPSIAITDTFVVASQSAMLSLTAQVGDVAIRTDESKTYILQTAGASVLANWVDLKVPTSTSVTSVAGKTGVVTLVKGDVGLTNVDNTADTTKNVLSATKLTTARTINGVPFDGSANITVTDSTKVASTGAIVANRIAAFNDTTGTVIKDSGFTIATSVPAAAVFTDTVYVHPNDANTRHVTDAQITNWNNKVDTVAGKALSTNDYTTSEKNKLAGLNRFVVSATEPVGSVINDIWYQTM